MILEQAVLAPLVRGLLLNASGRPCAVVEGTPGKVPRAEFSVDVGPAVAGGVLDEAAVAELLTQALAAAEAKRLAAGHPKALPGAVQFTVGEETRHFWAGATLDAARTRREAGDTTSWTVEDVTCDGRAAAKRGEVVRSRIALVTGGAQGFGEEIVRGLAASGALVFIADLNVAGAEKLAKSLNAEAGHTVAVPVVGNVADEASVEAMFRTVAETAGGLDLCVSNAGVLKAGSVLEQDAKDFRFVTEVNYTAFFLVTKHAGRLLRRQRRTAPRWTTDIVQINSKSGLEGSNKNAAYAGGKFGGIGLVASFALELVAHGVKVNAICPGNFFDGPLWSDPEKGLFVQYLRAGKVPGAKTVADVKAFYEAKVPMGRGCEGADVMRALYYIVEQAYETGQAVPVTGGQVMLH
jgi:sorbitol-6-phosphate 2-dehydrogenase